jgi:hypothetical protein
MVRRYFKEAKQTVLLLYMDKLNQLGQDLLSKFIHYWKSTNQLNSSCLGVFNWEAIPIYFTLLKSKKLLTLENELDKLNTKIIFSF